jgi:hypothetical protein
MTRIDSKVGATHVRLEDGLQTPAAAGKGEEAALRALGGALKKNDIRLVIDGEILTGDLLAKTSWSRFSDACRARGLDPKDTLQLLDDVNIRENRGRTIDISSGTQLARTLGLSDGVDGTYASQAAAEKQRLATDGLRPPVRPTAAKPEAGTTPRATVPDWATVDPAEVAKLSPDERQSRAEAYDRRMQREMSVDQYYFRSGSLDGRHNCIAASKVMMLRMAGIVRTDASLADVVRRAGAEQTQKFHSFDAKALGDLNAALPALRDDPGIGAGGSPEMKVGTVNRTQAIQAMEQGQVVMAYVHWGGVSSHHVVGLYHNPYSGQTMALDPLGPERDDTPNVFPISMDPADKTETNSIRVSHTRFWALVPAKKPRARSTS